ncbi:WecB/TagA/CpsF family glycosyltransferase [Gelatiniphilus marinus]|uniref:WecB/TagA/CpsF family glycosyltransferase n=1 Tax=Gelatiniphilus marinus TaxID=1759464 RepID=A0ABW5JUQ8_9FLAO
MKRSVLDYNIFEDNINTISIKGKSIINTINPHSYVIAKQDRVFNEALLKSDVLLPDGIGIVYALKLLKSKKIKKIAGHDIFLYLLNKLNSEGGTCFFLGSTNTTLSRIEKKIKEEYPKITVGTYSPPFKAEFTKEDNSDMISKINAVNPDILFVGMTAPKQEKWSFQNKGFINASVICSIGAVFDFYAETVKRPSGFWVYLGLEWLVRLVKNPSRLWRRTFVSTPIFIKDVLVLYFKKGF